MVGLLVAAPPPTSRSRIWSLIRPGGTTASLQRCAWKARVSIGDGDQ